MPDYFKGWYSTEELIRAARDEGVNVTASQITRWHRTGLLPKPKRDYTTGRRGTVTRYPPGTLHTLLAICKVQTGRTPMDEVSWALWWSGNDRDIDEIRRYMEKVTRDLDSFVAKVRSSLQRGESLKGVPGSVRDSLVYAPALRGPLGWIRRPLQHGGRNDWPVMVDLLLDTMSGRPPQLTESSGKVITDALHQGQAYEVTVNDQVGWMPEQTGETLTWISAFMQRTLAERLASSSDAELESARDEAQRLLEFGLTFGEVMAWLFRPDGLGYGFMKKVLELFVGRPDRQVFLVLLIHALMTDQEYGNNFDSLHGTYDKWANTYEGHRCLMTLVDEVPGLNVIINSASMSAAFRSSVRREQLVREIVSFRSDHTDAIDKVVTNHPELNWSAGSEIQASSEELT